MGDNMVNIATDLWQIPLTALWHGHPTKPRPPPRAASGVATCCMTAVHYMGLANIDGEPALLAEQLFPQAAPPAFEIPEGYRRHGLGRPSSARRISIFTTWRRRWWKRRKTPGACLLTRQTGLATDFDDARVDAYAADTAGDANARVAPIGRMSGFYRVLGDVLRQAREGARLPPPARPSVPPWPSRHPSGGSVRFGPSWPTSDLTPGRAASPVCSGSIGQHVCRDAVRPRRSAGGRRRPAEGLEGRFVGPAR